MHFFMSVLAGATLIPRLLPYSKVPRVPTYYYYYYLNLLSPIVGQVAQSVYRLTTGWTVRDRILVRTRFSSRPDRPWGPPSHL